MEISFRTERLQKTLESERDLRRKFGPNSARKIAARISDLQAAASLADCRHLPGRCHELGGDRKGQLALDLADGHRLVLAPRDGWPVPGNHGDHWSLIEAVELVEIVDYH